MSTPAGDRGAPSSYCGARTRRLELKDIAESMAGLVLDGDDGTGGVVEELVGDLRKHDGTSAACKPAAAHELTRENVGLGPAATRARTGRRAMEDGGGAMGDEDEHRNIRICAAADRRRRASRPLGFPSRLSPILPLPSPLLVLVYTRRR